MPLDRNEKRTFNPKIFHRREYKKFLGRISEWNYDLPKFERLHPEPSFSKVRNQIEQSIKNCKLNTAEFFWQVFPAALSWSDDLEYKAMRIHELDGVPTKKRLVLLYSPSDREMAKTRLDKVRITVEVMSNFLKDFVQQHPDAKKICKILVSELEKEEIYAEEDKKRIDSHFKGKKPASSRDKAIHGLYSILSKNLGEDKNEAVYREIGHILQSIYRLKNDYYDDWVAAMRSCRSRHEEASNGSAQKGKKK